MKKLNLKTLIAVGLTLAGAAFTPNLQAALTNYIEGGSASRLLLYDRATNFYAGGSFTSTGTGSSNVRRFQGNSLNPLVSGYNPITLDFNVNNGAVYGLQSLVNGPGPASTNIDGTVTRPTFVDSATSPDVVGVDPSSLAAYPTYVVPLVFVKNTNFPDLVSITNLTQRQAWSLEHSTLQATYFGGTSTNKVYFVGRNSGAAVRTEIDLNIYNSTGIKTYYTNGVVPATPILDVSADPGYSSGTLVQNTVIGLTNSIGTLAVQDIKSPLGPIAYEGITYSVTNVINGSYPIWGYENYYYLDPAVTGGAGVGGAPTTAQQTVLDVFYGSVTNSSFQASNPVFVGKFIPNPALQVKRDTDGGQIKPLGSFFQ